MKINEKAMLVHLRISMWTGSHKDGAVTQKVCNEFGVAKDAGTWWTHYVPPEELEGIKSAAGSVRNTWIKWTMPWLDGGVRIVPSGKYNAYLTAIQEAIKEYNKACDAFLLRYPAILEASPERLKSLKDGKNMPSVDELRNRFGVTHDIFPMPSTEDFRLQGVSEGDTEKIKEQMEESLKLAFDETLTYVWQSLLNLLEKVDKVMSEPNKKFKDSLIKNLEKFIDDLPSLNIVDDPGLEETRKKIIKQFMGIDPQDLRESDVLRKGIAKQAKAAITEITARIGNVGRKIDLDIE